MATTAKDTNTATKRESPDMATAKVTTTAMEALARSIAQATKTAITTA